MSDLRKARERIEALYSRRCDDAPTYEPMLRRDHVHEAVRKVEKCDEPQNQRHSTR